MKKEEIRKGFADILEEKGLAGQDKVIGTANLTHDIGLDSLDTVEVIMECEKKFGILIPDNIAEGINTVNDAVIVIYDAIYPPKKIS